MTGKSSRGRRLSTIFLSGKSTNSPLLQMFPLPPGCDRYSIDPTRQNHLHYAFAARFQRSQTETPHRERVLQSVMHQEAMTYCHAPEAFVLCRLLFHRISRDEFVRFYIGEDPVSLSVHVLLSRSTMAIVSNLSIPLGHAFEASSRDLCHGTSPRHCHVV